MSNTGTEEDPMKVFARALFNTGQTDDDAQTDDDDKQTKPTGNFVPLEGNNPQSQDNSDEEFLRLLFDA